MKLAVIADVHGNHRALQAVLADIERQSVEAILNLGDHLSGPLNAKETARLLMQVEGMVSIRGNHDRWLVEQAPQEMGRSDAHAHSQLSPEHLAWLAALPPTLVFRDEIFLCHGTPQSDLGYWLETVEGNSVRRRDLAGITEDAAGLDYPVLLCGHTHLPQMVRLQDGRLVINPGSVGCPGFHNDAPHLHRVEAGTPHATYAVLEKGPAGWSAAFRMVAYDNAAAAEEAARNGRTEWASALATGWVE